MALLLSHAVQDVLITRRREEFIDARRIIMPEPAAQSSFSVNDSGQLRSDYPPNIHCPAAGSEHNAALLCQW